MDSFELAKIAGGILMALIVIFGLKTAIEIYHTSHAGNHGEETVGYALPAPEGHGEDAKKEMAEGSTKSQEKAGTAATSTSQAPSETPSETASETPSETEAAKPMSEPTTSTSNAATESPAESTVAAAATGNAKKGKSTFRRCLACHSSEKGGPNKAGPSLWGIVGRAKASVDGFKYSKAMTDKGGNWTAAELNEFLRKPKKYVPGTKMIFAGFKKEKDLANIISYLETLK